MYHPKKWAFRPSHPLEPCPLHRLSLGGNQATLGNFSWPNFGGLIWPILSACGLGEDILFPLATSLAASPGWGQCTYFTFVEKHAVGNVLGPNFSLGCPEVRIASIMESSPLRRPAQQPWRGPATNGSEAMTEMPNLSYAEMDRLTPCHLCGSRRDWFDGEVWQCWNCVPPPSADIVRIDLNERVNRPGPRNSIMQPFTKVLATRCPRP
jgi:hypothetical protein